MLAHVVAKAVSIVTVLRAEIIDEEDHAEVICLGCGGMAGLMERVRVSCGTPVVDGVAAAVTIAEALVRMGLTTSKVRTYAPPRPKAFTAWPPSAAAIAAYGSRT